MIELLVGVVVGGAVAYLAPKALSKVEAELASAETDLATDLDKIKAGLGIGSEASTPAVQASSVSTSSAPSTPSAPASPQAPAAPKS